MLDVVLFSPHNDDAALFACYAVMRYQPVVYTCIRAPAAYGPRHVREAEDQAAMQLLGAKWEQWQLDGDDPDWEWLNSQLASVAVTVKPSLVLAPLPEPEGHVQHNMVGNLVAGVFGDRARVRFYSTYTHRHGRTEFGVRDSGEPGWDVVKRQALNCYASQKRDPRTRMHFERPLDEYYSAQARS